MLKTIEQFLSGKYGGYIKMGGLLLLAAIVIATQLFSGKVSMGDGSSSSNKMETSTGNTNQNVTVSVGGDLSGNLDMSKKVNSLEVIKDIEKDIEEAIPGK